MKSFELPIILKKGQFYVNPVVDRNHPDPGVLKLPDGSGFVAVSTSTSNHSAFPIMFSSDLVNWEKVIIFYASSKAFIKPTIRKDMFLHLNLGHRGPFGTCGPQKFISLMEDFWYIIPEEKV